eukprot:Sspe_Gene.57359::Locus_31478_Transcript_1_1_Confidence_1.000_Length_1343::g.57359::m.57359
MRVGKYELGKTIGRGAFSKVKVAIHTETEKEYVLKIIDKRGNDSGKTAKDVEAEVKLEISIMKILNHENIVKMYEVMESSKHYYIVLESVRGGDLCDHVMDAGKLSEDIARKYLQHLVYGLIACHQAGVAHRDIKPENCLISTEGILKVADFGLSRLHRGRGDILDQSEMSTDSVGTLSYAAPEVLDGRYNAFKADLWSVGVVIFVMCTGKFPFGSKGYTEAQIQEDIRRAKINKFPSHLSPEVKDLINKLIIVDPDKRISLTDILDHPWVKGAQPKEPTRRRPIAIDVDQVKAEAMSTQAEAINGTMSPTWADSPVGGARNKFIPALFSPRQGDSPTHAKSPRSPPSATTQGLDINGLKGLLEKEGRQLGAK